MTVPIPLTAADPADGCTACGTQNTVQLHPRDGRRCPEHVTLPDGAFRSDLSSDMASLGRADRAFTYLGTWLRREINNRFAAAAADTGTRRLAS